MDANIHEERLGIHVTTKRSLLFRPEFTLFFEPGSISTFSIYYVLLFFSCLFSGEVEEPEPKKECALALFSAVACRMIDKAHNVSVELDVSKSCVS